MAVITVPANRSLTLSSKLPQNNINSAELRIGTDGTCVYYSYLYFDLSSIPCNIFLRSAELILFKTSDFFFSSSPNFVIRPLLKLFSSCSTYENNCAVDFSPDLKREFCPFTTNVAIEINITLLISHWIHGTLVNRGIVIEKEKSAKSPVMNLLNHTTFGSAFNPDRMLIPFIRITFSSNFFPPNITYKATPIPSGS